MTDSFAIKLGFVVGGAAMVSAPLTADAALVTRTTPVSVSLFDLAPGSAGAPAVFAAWDIDGNSITDFNLFAQGSRDVPGNHAVGVVGLAQPFVSTFSDLLFGLVHLGDSTNVGAVANSAVIGYSTIPAGYGFQPFAAIPGGVVATLSGNYLIGLASGFGARSSVNGALTFSTGTDFDGFAFSFGTHNFVFAYFDTDGPHVGWGVTTLTATSLTISEWTYNTRPIDEPNGGIHVGTVPEPASPLPAIVLLAAGAAGVRSWRQRAAD